MVVDATIDDVVYQNKNREKIVKNNNGKPGAFMPSPPLHSFRFFLSRRLLTPIRDAWLRLRGKHWSDSLTPESGLEMAAALRALAALMTEPPLHIYYPCCGHDTTPSLAFPKAEILYLDFDEISTRILRRTGYTAANADALKYGPAQFVDLLVLFNPQLHVGSLVRHVRDGGYIICNNYHGTADELWADRETHGLTLLGTTSETPDGGLVSLPAVETSNLHEYFVRCNPDTLEKLKSQSPFLYKFINHTANQTGQDPEIVFQEHKKIGIIDCRKKTRPGGTIFLFRRSVG